jgi:hypothetical protein
MSSYPRCYLGMIAMVAMRSAFIRLFTAFFILGVVVVVFLCAISCGETTSVEWERTYGGSNTDWAWAVEQTRDGGYIIAGSTESYGSGESDAWLVKTDERGNEQGSKTYGGHYGDGAFWVQQSSDGGYILAGYTDSFGAGGEDLWLLKTDEAGREEWSQTYGGEDDDLAYCVQETPDGGYIAAGVTQSYGAGGCDLWLIKINATGKQQWAKTFGGARYDLATCVQPTSDGGYVLAGTTSSFGAGSQDLWVVKVNCEGEEEWNKTFGTASDEGASSIQETSDTGYIVVGFGRIYEELWLVKMDNNGREEWTQILTRPSWDAEAATSVQQTTDGGYIIAGGIDKTTGKGVLVKVGVSGEEEWTMLLGSSGLSLANSVRQTSDGGYVVAGMTRCIPLSQGTCDFWLVKVAGTEGTRNEKQEPASTPAATFVRESFPRIPTPTPEADFSASQTSGEVPITIQFIDQSSGPVYEWGWDLDGDLLVDSKDHNPEYTYEEAGNYTISLRVAGPNGSDIETKKNYLILTAP